MRYTMRLLAMIMMCMHVAQAANATCARADEADALNLRALQSTMMVAALSCGQQESYNDFMQQFQFDISESGSMLASYFKRAKGDSYKRTLNKFVTGLANKVTNESFKGDFCDRTDDLFDDLADIEGDDLYELAENEFSELHGIKPCEDVATRK